MLMTSTRAPRHLFPVVSWYQNAHELCPNFWLRKENGLEVHPVVGK